MIAIFLLAIGFLAFFGLINFMMHEQVGDHNDLVSDDVKASSSSTAFDQGFEEDNFNDPLNPINPMNRYNPCSPYYENSNDLTDPTNPMNSLDPCSQFYDNSTDLCDPTNMSNYTNIASPLCDESFRDSVMGADMFDDITSTSSFMDDNFGGSSMFNDPF